MWLLHSHLNKAITACRSQSQWLRVKPLDHAIGNLKNGFYPLVIRNYYSSFKAVGYCNTLTYYKKMEPNS